MPDRAGERHVHIVELCNRLNQKLAGYYQYYGITDNFPALRAFFYHVEKIFFKWMNRRSQRKSFNWDRFRLFLGKWPLAKPRINVDVYDFDAYLLAICNGVMKSRVR